MSRSKFIVPIVAGAFVIAVSIMLVGVSGTAAVAILASLRA